MISKIKKMTLYDYIDLFKVMITYIPGRIYKKIKKQEITLISERPNDARDNGYHFFKYMREKHPERLVYYPINKQSKDYIKIKNMGNVIEFGSIYHHFLFWSCDKHISAHIGNGFPSHRICYNFLMWNMYDFQNIFIQHGIVKSKLPFLFKENTNLDMLTTTCPSETNFLTKNFGYKREEIKEIGLLRYDDLYDTSNKPLVPTKILLMPTWRMWLIHKKGTNKEKSIEKFKKSKFYLHYQSLISNERLIEVLDKENVIIEFVLHSDLSVYSEMFYSKSKRIKICAQNEVDIQGKIKESKMLITDYSSIFFDFAYLEKPIIFYKFDEDEFYTNHYLKGGLENAEDSKFGFATNSEHELISKLTNYIDGDFENEKSYVEFAKRFFTYKDKNNCERLYKEVYHEN